jgi:hypothetical protein
MTTATKGTSDIASRWRRTKCSGSGEPNDRQINE